MTVKKSLKRAGATPLFRLPAAQKVVGVAPARFSRKEAKSNSRKLCVAPIFGGASAKHDDLTEFRTKTCMAGPHEGEQRNASLESTTETNSQRDDSGTR